MVGMPNFQQKLENPVSTPSSNPQRVFICDQKFKGMSNFQISQQHSLGMLTILAWMTDWLSTILPSIFSVDRCLIISPKLQPDIVFSWPHQLFATQAACCHWTSLWIYKLMGNNEAGVEYLSNSEYWPAPMHHKQ